MGEKEDTSLLFKNVMIVEKTQFRKDVEVIRSDNGLEFLI